MGHLPYEWIRPAVVGVVVLTFLCYDKYLRNDLQGESFILAHIFRGFHGRLTLLFLGQVEAQHHGRRTWRSTVDHLMESKK
jgi:hypothetical protein